MLIFTLIHLTISKLSVLSSLGTDNGSKFDCVGSKLLILVLAFILFMAWIWDFIYRMLAMCSTLNSTTADKKKNNASFTLVLLVIIFCR